MVASLLNVSTETAASQIANIQYTEGAGEESRLTYLEILDVHDDRECFYSFHRIKTLNANYETLCPKKYCAI